MAGKNQHTHAFLGLGVAAGIVAFALGAPGAIGGGSLAAPPVGKAEPPIEEAGFLRHPADGVEAAPVPSPERAARSTSAFSSDVAAGERLYGERCPGCHDNPGGRTPSREAIAASSYDALVQIMMAGAMKPFAEGLSRGEITSIAVFLGRQGPSAEERAASMARVPACTAAPEPLRLAGEMWNGWGRTTHNARFQPEPGLAAADVPRLKLKWAFPHAGNRAGQAIVSDGRLFVNSTSGMIYSLDAESGCVHWRYKADGGSRSTMSIGRINAARGAARHALYLTDSTRHAYALDADTGEVLWKTQVDDQRGSLMTGSPTLHAGRLFVPVSSAEEAIALNDAYECCKVRGNLVALDARTGRLLWKTFTTQQANRPYRLNAKGVQMYGPAGGAIWSAPTVDAKRGLVYVATSNSHTDFPHEGSDAVIAMEMETGAIRWINQVTPNDNYIIDCYPTTHPRPANCPRVIGGDYALGSSPILHELGDGSELLIAAQKSSEIYAMDPAQQGKILWQHRLSVGGPLGGIEFGPAADEENVYVPVSDIFMWRRARPGLTAIRLRDGKILWHTPNPGPSECRWKNVFCNPGLSQAITVIPGIVFAGSLDGILRAYATGTGEVVWQTHTADAPMRALNGKMVRGGILDAAGPTSAGGTLYVHSGYAGRDGEEGSVLLAYSVDGK